MKHLYYDKNQNLYLELVDLFEFAQNHLTPFYIYSSSEIRKNCQEILTSADIPDLLACYALKANYNPAIIKIIQAMGFGADVVSAGELYFAQKCGIPPEKTVFAGVGKTSAEIELAIRQGIHSINIESESELNAVAGIARDLKKKVRISIRVNPDIDAKTHPYISTGLLTSKFGLDRETAMSLYKQTRTMKMVEASGIHVHIGSQISLIDPFRETLAFLDRFIGELAEEGIRISCLDLGGGIGIDYHNQLNDDGYPKTYIRDILPAFLASLKKRNLKIILELGRSVIGSAGLLIARIIYVKKTPQKKFYIIDAAMNNLIRPSLYNAYHQIIPLHRSNDDTEIVDIVGPVCETSDFLARDRMMPIMNEGDHIAITGAGAYSQALSSNYNLRPTLAEYLVEKNQSHKIYDGETIAALAAKFNL
jgi:diaminopimelate decarboxylase